MANLPRKHLGHAYYHSTLKPVGASVKRNFASNRGFASTPDPLPDFEGSENCTFTIKVPKVYLDHTSLEEITQRKAVWGTDIYTDDSDVIAACIHQGWFRGAWPEDIEQDILVHVLDLKQDDEGSIIPPEKLQRGKLYNSPSAKGAPVPNGCDCHITILILPLLENYGSTTRFGIRSREWGVKRDGFKSKHDGISYMIQSIRFVHSQVGEESTSGTRRKSIMNQQLSEREIEAEESWGDLLMNGNGNNPSAEREFEVSFERGTGPARLGDVMGIGNGSWWKKPAPAPAPAPIPASNGRDKAKDEGPEPEPPKESTVAPSPHTNHPQPLPAPEIEPLDDLELASHISSKSKSRSPLPRPVVIDAPVPVPIPELEGSEWVVVEKEDVAGEIAGAAEGDKDRERERQINEMLQRMVRNANQGVGAVEVGKLHGTEGKRVDGVHEGRENEKGEGKEVEDPDPDTTLDADVTME